MSRIELINELKNNFNIQELVCQHCYNKFGEDAWQFLSTELLYTLYVIRYEIFKCPITINNWSINGQLSQRGLRCNLCDIVKNKNSAYLSAHCLGKAIDFNVKGHSTEQVYEKIKNNISKFKYPIRIEINSTTWNHVDVYQPIDSNKNLIEFKD